MIVEQSNTFAKLYAKTLEDLVSSPEHTVSPRGKSINECTNSTMILTDPLSNFFKNKERVGIEKYLAGEFIWYFLGRKDLAFIEKYSKFWKKIANNDNTLNSAYGNLIFNRKNDVGHSGWSWARHSLLKDIDTRQAIMHFNTPNFLYENNKDQVCTMYVQFIVREDKLDLHVYMRSNDLVKGTTYDIPFFATLQSVMHKVLQIDKYPTLKIGKLYHNATSLHIYASDFDLIDKMLDAGFEEYKLPEISELPICCNGTCTRNMELVAEKKYVGEDKFLNWLQENS